MRNPRPYRSGSVAILPLSRSTFEITGAAVRDGFRTQTDSSSMPDYVEKNWLDDCLQIGEFRISPNGRDNLFPQRFKELLDTDNIMHGILRQKIDLLMAGNWHLVTDLKDGNKIIEDPVIDNRIQDWLDSFDFETYLAQQVTDFVYVENNATQFILTRAAARNLNSSTLKIAKLRYCPIEDVRMEPLGKNGLVNHYFEANWFNPVEIAQYPAYDRAEPLRHNGAVMFVKMPTFGSKYYGRPPFIGITNYIYLKNLIMNWTRDNLTNSSFKWHIESPFEYWEKIAESNGWTMDSEEMIKYENDVMSEIDSFLSSDTAENAQKRFHSKFALSEFGKERLGWKITHLEDKTKDNSEAYLKSGERINEAIVAAANMDPALSGIYIPGKLSSGLDKLIAFNIHQLVTAPMPRRLVLKAVNEAIRINFHRSDYRPRLTFKSLQLNYSEKGKAETTDDNN